MYNNVVHEINIIINKTTKDKRMFIKKNNSLLIITPTDGVV